MKNKFYSVIRIFVECSEFEAKNILETLVKIFEPRVSNIKLEKYYKFENSYELSFLVEQNNITPDNALKEVCYKIGEGWNFNFTESPNDYTSSADWNEFKDNILINNKVFFANVETSNPVD